MTTTWSGTTNFSAGQTGVVGAEWNITSGNATLEQSSLIAE